MAKDDNAATGTVVPRDRVAAFHKRMADRAELDTDRSAEVMAQQAERIFTAESVDDILSADMGGTVQMRDVPGTVWRIHGMNVNQSNRTDIENSHGYYVSADATYLGGPPDVARTNGLVLGQSYALQTGAELAVFKLAMLEARAAFPIALTVVGIKTGSGNQVIKLGPAPESVADGQTAE